MIDISSKENCCGCSSCAQICSKKCITMQPDDEGFLYPHVDSGHCIDCGLCEKVCPKLNPYPLRKTLNVFAANNCDDVVRIASSSGGIFAILAERTIKNGGVVFGARFDNNWQVVMDYTETMNGVKLFMGSKYVQASSNNTYSIAKQFLNEGRQVLYTGTPCQIAGLQHFLRKPYDNLIAVDVVCHGVPSPKVWTKYLDEIVEEIRFMNDITFRKKQNILKRLNFKINYDKDGKWFTLSSYHHENHYMKALINNLTLRPSCANCMAKCGRSNSDITIADYWGVSHFHPALDDDKGTSIILINTEKGRNAINWHKLKFEESTFDKASRFNAGLKQTAKFHQKRRYLFDRLDSNIKVTTLIDKSFQIPFKQRIFSFIRELKKDPRKVLKVQQGVIRAKRQKVYKNRLLPTISFDDIRLTDVAFRTKDKSWKNYFVSFRFKVVDNISSNN